MTDWEAYERERDNARRVATLYQRRIKVLTAALEDVRAAAYAMGDDFLIERINAALTEEEPR